MFRTLAFFLLALNSVMLHAAVGPPELRCISVLANGNVSLNWQVPADPSSQFVSYKVFRSSSLAGPYTMLASLPLYAQTSYTDLTVNANPATFFYYVQTEYNAGSTQMSASSDTLESVRIVVSSLVSKAVLRWNDLHTPSLSSSAPLWYIYQRMPASSWELIDSTGLLGDTILINGVCTSTTIEYKVERRDDSGCSSWSSVQSGSFRDYNQPSLMYYDSVSVDTANNRPVLGWSPNMTPDVRGYIIYKWVNNTTPVLDTVFGQLNTIYFDNTSDPATEARAYRIAAFDSCYNTAPWESFQQTIHLKSRVDACMGGVVLNWTRYLNWPQGVSSYSVYAKMNDSVFVLLANLSGSDTSYLHQGPMHAQNYCYVVRANASGSSRTSTSNLSCNYINTPAPPAYLYAKQANVLSPSQVEVTFIVDPSSDASIFHLERAEDSGSFYLYDSIEPGTQELVYVDDTAQTDRHFYRYRLSAVDTCGNYLMTSNLATSIRLVAKAGTDLVNTLAWNSYGDYASDHVFEIYRQINGSGDSDPLVILSDTATRYTDDVYDYLEGNGDFCYYIDAVETGTNAYGVQGRSRSSVNCIKQLPKLYLPNAFTPNGDNLNDIFMPVNVFVDMTDYLLVVYDRRGQKIFESNDPQTGWDGTYKGDPMPLGAYPYYIYVRSGEAEPYEKAGSVSVLR